MASKLLSHGHLRAICSSNNSIRSPPFPNPTRATRALLNLRLFSDASSASLPETPQSRNNSINDTGMGTPSPSSLKELELAKFASIAETWSAFKLINLFSISFSCYCLFGWWEIWWEIERNLEINLFSISFSCYCLFGWWEKRWEIERNLELWSLTSMYIEKHLMHCYD